MARFFLRRKPQPEQRQQAKASRSKRLLKLGGIILVCLVVWGFLVWLLYALFGPAPQEQFQISIWAERVQVGIFNLSSSILLTWCIMAVLIIGAILIRIFVIPRMKERPRGIQAVLEILVETISKYTDDKVPGLGDNLGAYIFTVAFFLIGSAVAELFGIRAPTADITVTFGLSLLTFLLINYYGIKKRGILGRLKSMATPSPMIFPMKVISDIAIPVSLACRLFGNMLGGMIVIDLLYYALGNAAIGIPSVLGLYFNVFHPMIQAFIFITLSLAFINEAVE